MSSNRRNREGSSAFWLLGIIAISAFLPGPLPARPFVPENPGQVLEQLPGGSRKDLAAWEAELRKDPANLSLACRVSWRYVEKMRGESDPRYLSYAEAALRPWWRQTNAPEEILLLRATIRQSNHEFQSALEDLDRLLRLNPAQAQAWVTRATIEEILGNYAEARKSCLHLVRLSGELAAVTCAASVGSLSGSAEQSYLLLRQTLERDTGASAEEKLWAWTLLGEIGARLGHSAEAESAFRQALAIRPGEVYLLGAYADFLLDQARPAEAVALLRNQTRVDSLLLRLALAEKASQPPDPAWKDHTRALEDRFSASRLRGDTRHRREEARFRLHLLADSRGALRLARDNWAIQREPADARILLEAAEACGDLEAARPVWTWANTNRLEDLQIRRLLK